MTIQEAVRFGTDYLAERNLKTPRRDVELILMSILQRDRTFVLAHSQYELSPAQEQVFHQWLLKRGEHYPLQYLRGVQEFYGREFLVTPAVLIPRPETELVVETSLAFLRTLNAKSLEVAEVGCGSGCIAVTLACELPQVRVSAVDVSAAALECTRCNAERHACLQRVNCFPGDTLQPLAACRRFFHLLVSNPPYVASLEREAVERSVAEYEPAQAVFAGEEGMDVYRKLFAQGPALLRPEGRLIVELGYDRADQVRQLAGEQGWVLEELRKDLSGLERCAIFRT